MDHHADWLIAAAAIATIVGHIFPVWLGFRGGKGVATGVGVFLILAPIALLCAGVHFRCDCVLDEVRITGFDSCCRNDSVVCLVAERLC